MTLPPVLTQVGRFPVIYVPAHPENTFQSNPQPRREGVVAHVMEGTLAGCDSWFANPGSKSSATAGISKAGEIHQFVQLYGNAPFANGVPNVSKVTSALVKSLMARHPGVNVNMLTWSIEHEGFAGEQITDYPAMFEASTVLCAALMMDIDPAYRDTYEHAWFDPVNRARCPGWTTATWAAYDGRVQELIGAAEHGPIPPAEPILTGQPDDWKKIKATLDAAYDAGVAVEQAVAVMRSAMSEVYAEIRRQLPNAV